MASAIASIHNAITSAAIKPASVKPSNLKRSTFLPALIKPVSSRKMQARGQVYGTRMAASTHEPRQEDGPMRFLKFAAGAGAATAALGAASWAVKKQREGGQHVHEAIIDEAVTAGAPASSSAGGQTYNVQKGDTLTSIARQFDSQPDIIKTVNGLKGDTLNAGQQIWIPRTYTIEKGDGLYKIARKFNTTVEQIQKINTISNPDLIYAGDVILLP